MIIKITMISGKTYQFENNKYKNISEWLAGNFKRDARWLQITKECKFVINIDLIEGIKEIVEE